MMFKDEDIHGQGISLLPPPTQPYEDTGGGQGITTMDAQLGGVNPTGFELTYASSNGYRISIIA